MKSLFDFFQLDDPTAEFKAEHAKHSLTSDLQILMMNQADCVERINALLDDQKVRATLDEDEEINLGCLRENLKRQMNDVDEYLKKIDA